MSLLHRLRAVDHALTRTPAHYLLAAVAIALITAVLEVPVYLADRIYYNPLTTLPEFIATIAAASILVLLTGSFIASLLIVQGLVISNYLKFFFLREGLIPSDFVNIREAMIGAGHLFTIGSIAAVIVTLTLAALFVNRRFLAARVTGLAVWAAIFAGAYVYPRGFKSAVLFGDYDRYWQVSSEFQNKGFFLSFATAAVDLRKLSVEMQEFPLLATMPAGDLRTLDFARIAHKPDIHVVLMESFINPAEFDALTFNRSPVPPALVPLIAAGRASSYSPVVGGKTAKAEFEVLCGVPDFDLLGTVTFNQMGSGPSDCLPRLLSGIGYHTMASTPLPGSFFNIKQAYKAVGFQERLLKDSFAFDDMDSDYLTNAATLRQDLGFVRNRIAANPDQPLFNYVVLLGGHFPFARNEQLRPSLIKPSPDVPFASDIANINYYTFVAVADFMQGIESLGRDSIVVLFGDHVPPVPDGFFTGVGYRGFDPAKPVTARRTFLLVMRNGQPIPVGNLAQYEVPGAIVRGLLEACGDGVCAPPAPVLLRPPGTYARSAPDADLCAGTDSTPSCTAAADKVGDMRRVYQHLVKQSYRPEAQPGVPVGATGPTRLSHAQPAH